MAMWSIIHCPLPSRFTRIIALRALAWTFHTDFGEDLSRDYLSYVREHPVDWNVLTDILYGSADNLTSVDTIMVFAQAHQVSIIVMENGDHWFYTEEQMQFLVKNKLDS